MESIQSFARAVLADLVRRQPPSDARTSFAWELAVGRHLAQATRVVLHDRVLVVSADDSRWRSEIEHAGQTVLLRMQHLLGRDAVRDLRVEHDRSDPGPRRKRLPGEKR